MTEVCLKFDTAEMCITRNTPVPVHTACSCLLLMRTAQAIVGTLADLIYTHTVSNIPVKNYLYKVQQKPPSSLLPWKQYPKILIYNYSYCTFWEREQVSWYFELSQPQRITSQPKTMFNRPLFTLQASHQTTNYQKNQNQYQHKFA